MAFSFAVPTFCKKTQSASVHLEECTLPSPVPGEETRATKPEEKRPYSAETRLQTIQDRVNGTTSKFEGEREFHSPDSKLPLRNSKQFALNSESPFSSVPPIATPEQLPDGGHRNALLEAWAAMHEVSPAMKARGEEGRTPEEIRTYVCSLGISTYLHQSLEDTLDELALQTVSLLKQRGAQLSEVEYVYIVSAVVQAWSEQSADERGQNLLATAPGLVLDKALNSGYSGYRKVIEGSYSESAELCLPALLAAGGSQLERDAAISKHLRYGDPRHLLREILRREVEELSSRQSVMAWEAEQEFRNDGEKLLQSFQRQNIASREIAPGVMNFAEGYSLSPQLLAREQRIQAQLALSRIASQHLWEDLLPAADSRGEAPPIVPFREMLRDRLSPEVQRLQRQGSSLAERLQRTRELSGTPSLLDFGARFGPRFSATLEKISREAAHSGILEKTQGEQLLSALLPDDAPREHLLQIFRDNPKLLERVETFLHKQSVGQTESLREQVSSLLGLNKERFERRLAEALRAEDPVLAVSRLCALTERSLPQQMVRTLFRGAIESSGSGQDFRELKPNEMSRVLACLEGLTLTPEQEAGRMRRRISELKSSPQGLHSYVEEQRAFLAKDRSQTQFCILALRESSNCLSWARAPERQLLLGLAHSLIEEQRVPFDLPKPREKGSFKRSEELEKLRLSLASSQKDETNSRPLDQRLRGQRFLEVWEVSQLQSRRESQYERSVQAPDLSAIPKELHGVLLSSAALKDPLAEIVKTAELWGRLKPLTLAPENATIMGNTGPSPKVPPPHPDPWPAEMRRFVEEAESARRGELYEQVRTIEREHGILVDWAAIRQAELQAQTRSQAVAFINERLKMGVLEEHIWKSLDDYGVMKILPKRDLADMILLARVAPLAEQLLQQEVLSAQLKQQLQTGSGEAKNSGQELGNGLLSQVSAHLLLHTTDSNKEQLTARLLTLCQGSDLVDVRRIQEQYKILAVKTVQSREVAAAQQKVVLDFIRSSSLPLPELLKQLESDPRTRHFDPGVARDLVVQVRGGEAFHQFIDLQRTKGFLLGARVRNEDAGARLKEVEKELSELQPRIEAAIREFPESFSSSQTKVLTQKALEEGLSQWNKAIESARHELEAKEKNKSGVERGVDNLEKGGKSALKLLHSFELLLAGNLSQLVGSVRGAAAGDIRKYRLEYGEAYIQASHAAHNRIWSGTSMFGSDEELAGTKNWKLAGLLNPLTHFSDAVIHPVFDNVELIFNESCRFSVNQRRNTPLGHREFAELQQRDPVLKNLKRMFHGAEIAASLAVIVGTGGAATAPAGVKIQRGVRALGVSTGISALTAGGQELLDHKDFDWTRFLDHTLKGTAQSLMFSAGMTLAAQQYIKAAWGKELPKTKADWQKLAASNPEDFLRLRTLLTRAQKSAMAVDALDNQGDFADAFAGFDKAETTQQFIGVAMMICGAAFDSMSFQASGAGRNLRAPNLAAEAMKQYKLTAEKGVLFASEDGSAIFVSDQAKLQEIYVRARMAEVSEKAPAVLRSLLEETFRAESKDIQAFTDRNTGVMVLPSLRPDSSRMEQLTVLSWHVHERAHARGLDERAAWKEQLEWLQEKVNETPTGLTAGTVATRFQVSLEGGRIEIRELKADEQIRKISNSDIEQHLIRFYPLDERVSGIYAAKGQQKGKTADAYPNDTEFTREQREGALEALFSADTNSDFEKALQQLVDGRVILSPEDCRRLHEEIRSRFLQESEQKSIFDRAAPYLVWDRAGQENLRTLLSDKKFPRLSPDGVKADWIEENRKELIDLLSEVGPRLQTTPLAAKSREFYTDFLDRCLDRLRSDDSGQALRYWDAFDTKLADSLFSSKLCSPKIELDPKALLAIGRGERTEALPPHVTVKNWAFPTIARDLSPVQIVDLFARLGECRSVDLSHQSFRSLVARLTSEQKMQILAHLSKVSHLNLAGPIGIGDQTHNRGLLELFQGFSPEETLSGLKLLSRVESLDLSQISFQQLFQGMDGAQVVQVFEAFGNLKSLSIAHCDLLETLRVMSLDQMSPQRIVAIFEHLGRCNQLNIQQSSIALNFRPDDGTPFSQLKYADLQRITKALGATQQLMISLEGPEAFRDQLSYEEIVSLVENIKTCRNLSLNKVGVLPQSRSQSSREMIIEIARILSHGVSLEIGHSTLTVLTQYLKAQERLEVFRALGNLPAVDISVAQVLDQALRSLDFRLIVSALTALSKSSNAQVNAADVKRLQKGRSPVEQLLLWQALGKGEPGNSPLKAAAPLMEVLKEEGLELSTNGRAVLVKDQAKMQEVYVTLRRRELIKAMGKKKFSEEALETQARTEAQHITAFFDKSIGVFFIPAPRSADRVQRVVAASWAVHEDAHSARTSPNPALRHEALGEQEAWRRQMDYLHKALQTPEQKYQVALRNGEIHVEPLQGNEVPVPVTDTAIQDHLKLLYSTPKDTSNLVPGRRRNDAAVQEPPHLLDREIFQRFEGLGKLKEKIVKEEVEHLGPEVAQALARSGELAIVLKYSSQFENLDHKKLADAAMETRRGRAALAESLKYFPKDTQLLTERHGRAVLAAGEPSAVLNHAALFPAEFVAKTLEDALSDDEFFARESKHALHSLDSVKGLEGKLSFEVALLFFERGQMVDIVNHIQLFSRSELKSFAEYLRARFEDEPMENRWEFAFLLHERGYDWTRMKEFGRDPGLWQAHKVFNILTSITQAENSKVPWFGQESAVDLASWISRNLRSQNKEYTKENVIAELKDLQTLHLQARSIPVLDGRRCLYVADCEFYGDFSSVDQQSPIASVSRFSERENVKKISAVIGRENLRVLQAGGARDFSLQSNIKEFIVEHEGNVAPELQSDSSRRLIPKLEKHWGITIPEAATVSYRGAPAKGRHRISYSLGEAVLAQIDVKTDAIGGINSVEVFGEMRGREDHPKVVRNRVLEAIRWTLPGENGFLCILEGHGSVDGVGLYSRGERSIPAAHKARLNAKDVATAFLEREREFGDRHQDILVLASCYSYDFAQDIVKEIQRRGGKGPIVIATTEFGQVTHQIRIEGKEQLNFQIYQSLFRKGASLADLIKSLHEQKETLDDNPSIFFPRRGRPTSQISMGTPSERLVEWSEHRPISQSQGVRSQATFPVPSDSPRSWYL